MIRILVENAFVFLVPTLISIAWFAFSRDDWPGLGAVIQAAPLLYLFVLGAGLMFVTLTVFSSRSHNTPGEAYVPPGIHDGKLQPGHAVPPGK